HLQAGGSSRYPARFCASRAWDPTMNNVEHLVEATYLGNTLWHWTVAASVAVVAFLVLLLIRRAIRSRYQKLAATPEVEFLELPFKVASRTTVLTVVVTSLFVSSQWLTLPPAVNKALLSLFTIAVFWQIGLWATVAVLAALERKRQMS